MKSIACFCLAALFEIGGCFTFWMWLRLHRSALWLIPGVVCLFLFAFVLTKVDAAYAGRAYAAYGGIYIAMSLLWLWGVEHTRPDRYDLLGSALCVGGAACILLAPHSR